MEVRSAEEFIEALQIREHKHNAKDYSPSGSIDKLVKGTYYLEKVDDMNRRTYGVKN
jgi:hydroxymethylglutaryl-CoA synthase